MTDKPLFYPLFCGNCGSPLRRSLENIPYPHCSRRALPNGGWCGAVFHPIKATDVFAIPTGEVLT